VEKPVSKLAFQVHNLQRYTEAETARQKYQTSLDASQVAQATLEAAVGLCRLNQVDP
jgi:hypothetical protein